MAKGNRVIWTIDEVSSPWHDFLKEFLEDTPARLQAFSNFAEAGTSLSKQKPDLLFVNPENGSVAFQEKLHVLRQSQPDTRVFNIGETQQPKLHHVFDNSFGHLPPDLSHFQKQLVDLLPLPEKMRVLIVDDEPEIGAMIQDFLGMRVNPSFEASYATNGVEGLKLIEKSVPDILILDIKMPIKDGREVYRELVERDINIPTIIFFDAISGEEIVEIHRIGRPSIIEKGSHQSQMTELLALIKKKAFFG